MCEITVVVGGGLHRSDSLHRFFFFFSSRRRHTRCSRDWSSDVCSSDLPHPFREGVRCAPLFAWGMDRVHRRASHTFAERVRGAVLLEASTQELARQHAYLDALIASTPVAIAVLDVERLIRSVNPAFEALFGYSAAEALGSNIDRLIVPTGLGAEARDLEARARRGEIVRVEVERAHKDGRHIPVRLSAAAVKAAAEGALVALYEDISDRKARSEEHTSELQSRLHLVCRLLLEKKKTKLRADGHSTLPNAIHDHNYYAAVCVNTPTQQPFPGFSRADSRRPAPPPRCAPPLDCSH